MLIFTRQMRRILLMPLLLIMFGANIAGAVPPLPTISGQNAGATAGTFEVSPAGAATYTIPLALPPGTAGMEPKLALTYDSSVPNGPFGPGWVLSGLSAITRCAATLGQDGAIGVIGFNYDDRYCLDGQRLVSLGGVNGGDGTEYRTRSESFSKIKSFGNAQSSPTHWVVNTKAGVTYEYGVTPNARHQSGSDTVSWSLSRVIDKKGNYFSVSYHQDTALGELILARIDYTGNENTGLLPNNSVVVVLDIYPGSADSAVSYLAGKRFASNKDIARIEVFSGTNLVTSYRPTYQYSQLLNNNRLIEFTQCDSSGVCSPATKFTWGADDPAANSFEQTYSHTFSASNYPDANLAPVVTGDWNGDGKTDLARVNYYGTHVFLATGSGLVKQPDIGDFGYSSSGYSNSYDYPLFTGDFNGDGCTDIGRVSSSGTQVHLSGCNGAFIGGFSHLYGFSPKSNAFMVGDWNGDGKSDFAGHVSGTTIRFYVSNGTSFSFVNDYAIHANLAPSDSLDTGDFNGDGLTDFSVHHSNSGTYYYVSTGNHFNVCYTGNQWPNSAACFTTAFNGGTGALIHGDWNGDGITDSGKILQNGFNACVSNGRSAMAHCKLIPAFGLSADSNITQRPLFVGDFNADGLTDVARVQSSGVRIFYARLYYDGTVEFHETTQLPDFGPSQGYSSDDAAPLLLGDWNGDGNLDFGRSTNMGHFLANHKEHQAQRIVGIEDGVGKVYAINYGELTDPTVYTKGSGLTYPHVDLQSALSVVASYAVGNGLGGQSINSYKYAGLAYNIFRRSIAGFQKIEVRNQDSGLTTTTWYRQDDPYEGMPYKKEVTLSSGTLVSWNQDNWGNLSWNQSGQWRYFPYVSQSTAAEYDTNGALVKSKATTNAYDDWGNLTQSTTQWSDGSSETTTNTYNNDPSQWILGQLLTSSVTKTGVGVPTLARGSKFTYNPATALLTQEEIEPNTPGMHLTKSYQHDAFGNITQTTLSAAGLTPRTTSKVYDSRGQFPVQSIDVLGNVTYHEYDPAFGRETKRTDPNGLVTEWEYDSFGRLYLERRADGTETRTLFLMPEAATALPNEAYYVRTDASGLPPGITRYDELGREIRKEAVGFNGQKIFIDKAYDERGLNTHVSEPYFEGSSPLWNVSEYDVLGRTTHITAPGDAHTTFAYNGLSTSTTNALGQSSTKVSDVQGRLKSSTDTQGNTVTYKYDSYGNLTEVADPAGNITTTEYDIQGRRTKIVDPDAGTSEFTYNAYGELLTQRNGKGEVVSFEYDDAGRTTKRSSPEGEELWLYDTAPNGVGKLAEVVGLNGYRQSYVYDSLSRIVETSTQIAGALYTVEQGYDELSRVESYTYPSGFEVQNLYNQYGYLSEMVRADTNAPIWRVDQRDARGQLEQQTLGNGLVTTKSYDPNTGVVKTIKTGAVQDLSFGFDKLGNLTQRADLRLGLSEDFKYDNLNRVTESKVAGQSPITVSYDALGNITSRSDVGGYLYGENGAGPHAVTSITGAKPNTYQYDAAGNRVASTTGTTQYNSSGKPVVITDTDSRLEFQLNPNDERVQEKRYKGGVLKETKAYVGGLFEHIKTPTGSSQVHYVQGGDGLVAVYTVAVPVTRMQQSAVSNPLAAVSGALSLGGVGSGSGPTTGSSQPTQSMRYLLLDHLGSIQTITDGNGAIVEVSSFDAWGRRRNPNTWAPSDTTITSKVSKGFTGHEQLDSVNLIHMNGRVYDPVIGRFISPDPIVQAPGNLQSLNRYSYVLNNPLSFTDPTGYFSFKKFWKKAKPFVKIGVAIAAAYFGQVWITNQLACSVSWATFSNSVAASLGVSQMSVASAAALAGGGFIGGATSSLLNGGGIGGALKEGLKAGVMAGLASAGMSALGITGQASLDTAEIKASFDKASKLYGEYGSLGTKLSGSLSLAPSMESAPALAKAAGQVSSTANGLAAAGGVKITAVIHGDTKSFIGEFFKSMEGPLTALGHVGTGAMDTVMSTSTVGWKVPTAGALVSRFSFMGNAIGAAYELGTNPASLKSWVDLGMGTIGFIPVLDKMTLGYDLGKAAAHGIDYFGGFDWWVNNRPAGW